MENGTSLEFSKILTFTLNANKIVRIFFEDNNVVFMFDVKTYTFPYEYIFTKHSFEVTFYINSPLDFSRLRDNVLTVRQHTFPFSNLDDLKRHTLLLNTTNYNKFKKHLDHHVLLWRKERKNSRNL